MTRYVTGGPSRFKHQRQGLRDLIERGGTNALLFDPGLGKTATAMDYMGLLALVSQTRTARVLVVCPLGAVDTWVMQASTYMSPQVEYWAEAIGGNLKQRADTLIARGGRRVPRVLSPRPRAHRRQHPSALNVDQALAWDARRLDGQPVNPRRGPYELVGPRVIIEVLNIDTFSQRRSVGSKTMADVMLEAVKAYAPDLMVLDESHLAKGSSSNVSRLLARIAQHVPRRVILTGTVMPHSPLDVWAQWRFLDPSAFSVRKADGTTRPLPYGAFRDRYAKMGGWMGKEVTGFRNLEHLQKIMAKRSTVARKEDALDLPPVTDATVPVTLSPKEQDAYDSMKRTLQVQFEDGTLASTPQRITQILRLRQITAGHLPDDGGGQVHTLGTSKVSAITSLVNDSLAGEKRVVVFGYFIEELQQLADSLATKGTEVLLVTGATSNADRMEARRRFGSEEPKRLIMVAQIQTMSLAVNELVTASHAVFATLPQRRDQYVQARDRLNRMGQTRPVTLWHAVVPGSIDEVVMRSHQKRTDLETAVLAYLKDD